MRRILPSEIFSDIEVHLNKLLNSYTVKECIHTRIKAIFLYRKIRNYSAVGIQLGTTHGFVRKWNIRICKELSIWDKDSSEKVKRKKLIDVLSDLPRKSGPKIYTSEDQCHVMATALKKPSDCQREMTHWTHIELADELNKTKLVEGISKSTVGRFLKQVDLRPHKSRYWLTPNIENEEEFKKEVKQICLLYKEVGTLLEHDTKVVSIDEKTGIQALEMIYPKKPTKPGLIERREFEYKRHGTLCLTPSFNIATGMIDTHTIDETRNEQDFLEHIKKTVSTSPKSKWIFVMDQLNTHKSESLVRWISEQCQIDEELGEKGNKGILKSMNSRMAFLTNEDHRIRFMYTPKHCSWLNQVEIWFSILARKLLNRGSFSSLDNLRLKLNRFVEYFNENLAKPFKWTYEGKILQA